MNVTVDMSWLEQQAEFVFPMVIGQEESQCVDVSNSFGV